MLVGRAAETARIDALLDAARHARSAALIVHGEPGIGKTSLLEQAVAAADGFNVLHVRPLQAEAELAFAGLADLVRPILHFLDRIPPPQHAALSGALALGPSTPGDRFSVAAATLSLLAAAGEEAPLLAVVDDAQWLDQPSREAMLFAARRFRHEGVVLLIGMRDSDWIGTAGVDTLVLRGLEPADAAVLVDSLGATVAPAVRDRLIGETGGNPLAILEAVATLSESELSGGAQIVRPVAVGAALERAFAERLELLPTATRRALLIAAASETGDAGEIRRALQADGLGATVLDAAERDGIVALGAERFTFRHPLVRSAAYHLHDPATRRAAHRALASAIGAGAPERAAWHLALSSVGPDEEVARALEEAGESTLARSAYSVAADAFEAAARLSPDPAGRLRRTMAGARALWLGGDSPRALALLDGVVELADDPIVRADLQQSRGMAMLFTRPIPETFALLVAEAGRVEAVDPAMAAAMLTNAALASFMAGEVVRAEHTSRRAVDVAPPGTPTATFATFVVGLSLVSQGHVADAAAIVESVLEVPALFESVGESMVPVAAICQGFTWLERFGEARRTLGGIVDAARRAGAPAILPFPLAAFSELELREGRIAAAFAAATESVQLAVETGQIVEAPYSVVTLARVEAVLGREDDCRAHVAAALESSRRTGAHSIEDYAGAALGLLELSLGRPDRAVAHLAGCAAFEKERGVRLPTVVPWGADLVEAHVRNGDAEEAAAALASHEERSVQTGLRWGLGTAARCRGLVADEDAYEAEFASALELLGDDQPFERARTQLCLGQRRRRSRRRAAARRALREALVYFERSGAEPWAEQVRVELRATGEVDAAAGDAPLRTLTPQELQVALVVAGGATNKEAAAALFLSPKTIEFHLGNAYRKLGIRSRAELVRRVERLS